MKYYQLFIVAAGMVLSATLHAAGDAEQGKAKSAVCAACHGVDGNSTNPMWPKLAGQSAKYIYIQLMHYKKNERVHALMNPQTAHLSEQDMHDLAAYYASQTVAPANADKALVEKGELLYRGGNKETNTPACIACHGPDGAGNPAAAYPMLSHQHAAYIEARLKQYRAAEVSYKNSDIMISVTSRLSDKEIKAVASYIQGLHRQ